MVASGAPRGIRAPSVHAVHLGPLAGPDFLRFSWGYPALVPRPPAARVPPSKLRNLEELSRMFALSKHEVRRILDTIDLTSPFGRRDYLLVLFMYHTGLRVGETSGLQAEGATASVDWSGGS